MEGFETVSSAADLSASIPSDVASGADADVGFEPASPDNEGVDTGEIDALNATGEEVEDPSPDNATNEDPADEEVEEPVADVAAATEDELPDGVRKGQDRSGKQGLFVTPERWAAIYDNGYKALKALEGIAGEPVTPQLFDVYNRAFLGQEKLYGDLLSGDPKAVGSVLSHFMQEGARAVQDGDVGSDPIVPLATQFYATVQEQHPEAYAALRMQAGTDLVAEMYAEAAQSGNRNLWLSAGHIAKTLGLPFKPAGEMETFAKNSQPDQLTALQRENQQLKAEREGRTANNQAAQFDAWNASTRQATRAAIMNDAVVPALAEVQAAWKKLPGGEEAFKDLVQERLHSQVLNTLKADTRFNERISLLQSNAARATSAQKRNEIGEQIKQAYVHRANLAIEANLPKIKSFAANAFKDRNAATHQRRASGAKHIAPGGSGTAVQRSLVPAGMDFEDATVGNLSKSLTALFQ